MIHVITGPPCAGKSTYVREHAEPGDVVVDFDAIAQALGSPVAHGSEGMIRECTFKARNAVIGHLLNHADAEAWIIHTSPADWQVKGYESADAEIIALDTDMETCLERAERDNRPPGTDEEIREWFANQDEAPKGAFFMPLEGGEMNIKTKTATAEAGGNGSITGYASTWTREPDCYGDVVAKGAFAESIASIAESGKAIPLLWNHDSGDLSAYIGSVTGLEEDDHGLRFTATFDGTPEAQRARELAQDGRLCKFSFSYDVLDQKTVELEDGTEANELRKLDIHEVSLVMYPANRDTSVVEVKGAPGAKAGRRNSAKDAGDLARISELCGSIQSIVNGLLESGQAEGEQGGEGEADGPEANAEEPEAANAEEPEAKAAEVDALLQKAGELLGKEGF